MTVIERLTEKDFNGYLRRRIPHELDQLVESVIDDYLGASSGIRASMRERLSPRSASVLTVYCQRAASMAVRKGSTELVYRGLIGIGLGYEREDDKRQSLYPLVALYDSAQRLGVSFIELVERAAGKIPEVATEALRDFDSRSERDKSLRSMGIATTGDGSPANRAAAGRLGAR